MQSEFANKNYLVPPAELMSDSIYSLFGLSVQLKLSTTEYALCLALFFLFCA